ncbi:hypothetical protein AB6F62_13360 [Providencia huaxiensis]
MGSTVIIPSHLRWLCFYEPPHSPYDQVPQKYLDAYRKNLARLNTRPNVKWDVEYQEGYGPQYFKEYLAMVNGVDEQFGRIVDGENKVLRIIHWLFFSLIMVVVLANGQPTKNNPYDESMRVPMMFRLPKFNQGKMMH